MALRHASRGSAWLVAVLSLTCALLPRVASAADDEDAVRVYRQLKPSVVSFKSPEGSGTGVLIDASGLILTNAHVVSSPMHYEVRLDVETPGAAVSTVVYKKVQVVGYHPSLDLALVRIDSTENRVVLTPAFISKSRGQAGQRVFVIGDPGAGGKVLTNSITNGMISAVDRVFEGEKYYQTDAAINPGNSGGPMCDRDGEVLGIVTFKFMGLEAIGFAIPLNDVDLRSFVPLTARKGNPKRAKEMLDQGENFTRMAEEARRTTPKAKAKSNPPAESPADFYNSMAANYYHEAVMYEPGNQRIYYKVGMLLESVEFDATDGDADDKDKGKKKAKPAEEDEAPEPKFDRHAVAAAYLARSIMLAPWENDGEAYDYLALAMIRQRHTNEALAAVDEGLAKFPYSARLWVRRAVSHGRGYQRAEPYRDATMAMFIGVKSQALDRMKWTVSFQRPKMSPAELDALAPQLQPDALRAALNQMATASNAARQARTLYITKPFTSLIARWPTVAAGNVALNIKDEPLKPYEQWVIDNRPPLHLWAANEWVDLFDGVDPAQDAEAGRWEREGFSLWYHGEREGQGKLTLPYTTTGSYQLELKLARYAQGGGPSINLPVGPNYVCLQLGGGANQSIGFTRIDNKDLKDSPALYHHDRVISPGRDFDVDVRVKLQGENVDLSVKLDEKLIIHWTGNQSSLAPEGGGIKASPFRLSAWTEFKFISCRLHMLSGELQNTAADGIAQTTDPKGLSTAGR